MRSPLVCVCLTLAALSCRHAPAEAPGSSCTLGDGVVLDVTGREDGIYGVRDGRVDAAPLARLDRTILESEGVDAASGKLWLGLVLTEDDAKQLEAFTSEPAGRSIAVVASGQVVSHHKIRSAIRSIRLQVSCCDRRACERLHGVFAVGRDGGS